MDTNDARSGSSDPEPQTESTPNEDRLYDALLETFSAERAAAGLTIEQLAVASGIGKRSLIRYLNGEREIPGRALTKIARGLGIPMGTIWRRAEDRIADR